MATETRLKIGGAVLTTNRDALHALPAIPPLENGDYLTRAEFERRYNALPWLKKAELIEGVVYMGSPVRSEVHAEPHAAVVMWAGVSRAATPGVRVADNATLRLDPDNEPQPDVMLRIEPQAGGTSRIGDDGYVEGAPELVIEIAASSATYDVRDKRTIYRRNGVREYIVWQVYDRQLDWWVLRDGEYQPLMPDESGVLRSEIFPGLWLDGPALLTDDPATLLATLQQGLASDEHAAFVEKLAASVSDSDIEGD
ncbi:MAG TPA: Uma2 family endonuclease [Roseiflexaceae bacterium]